MVCLVITTPIFRVPLAQYVSQGNTNIQTNGYPQAPTAPQALQKSQPSLRITV